ncbi:MAG: ribosomal-protein-alanine N-acetyltransferase [Anaerolineaceae bacterium]|nr:MAG: ribosomal-protein-alanine N-acetyltransferase [Anaerolineaceae bacterium]
MDILPATLRDLAPLRRVEQACFLKDAWPLLDLIAVLTWPDVVRLKAVEDGQMIGFVAGDQRPADNMAWIATIGVLPEYQRRGIGQALLQACEAKLPQPRVRLCVRASNAAAVEMYRREGYLALDTWKKYYDDGENALVMEKVRE